MTRADYVRRARDLFEKLAEISITSADEAREQAGLPEIWVWSNITHQSAHRLAVACQIHLLLASGLLAGWPSCSEDSPMSPDVAAYIAEQAALADAALRGELLDLNRVQDGLLRVGTPTPFGVVEQISLTAYRFGDRWLAFQTVHGKRPPAEPLIIFA
jgi:hypothetical protein